MDFTKYKKYKKEFDFSYTLGAFPTIELLNSSFDVICVFIHSKYENKEKKEKNL